MNSYISLLGPDDSNELLLYLLASTNENKPVSLSKFQNAFFLLQDGTLKELYGKETVFTDFQINSNGATSKGIQSEFLSLTNQKYLQIQDGDTIKFKDNIKKFATPSKGLKIGLGYKYYSEAKFGYFENRGEVMLEFLKGRMRGYMKMSDEDLHKMVAICSKNTYKQKSN